jgi:hypothetical protein
MRLLRSALIALCLFGAAAPMALPVSAGEVSTITIKKGSSIINTLRDNGCNTGWAGEMAAQHPEYLPERTPAGTQYQANLATCKKAPKKGSQYWHTNQLMLAQEAMRANYNQLSGQVTSLTAEVGQLKGQNDELREGLENSVPKSSLDASEAQVAALKAEIEQKDRTVTAMKTIAGVVAITALIAIGLLVLFWGKRKNPETDDVLYQQNVSLLEKNAALKTQVEQASAQRAKDQEKLRLLEREVEDTLGQVANLNSGSIVSFPRTINFAGHAFEIALPKDDGGNPTAQYVCSMDECKLGPKPVVVSREHLKRHMERAHHMQFAEDGFTPLAQVEPPASAAVVPAPMLH